jgi:extracellular factor (EF) 3-hydroxypalmitic acid methyl ester biosynthesis protein
MMNRSAAVLEKLEEVDVDWILSSSLENQVPKGGTLVRAGEPVRAVHIVLKGLLGVFAAEGGEKLAVVGPGGIVGEMSLLEDRTPTESVVALETTSVITLTHAELEARFERDPGFAARLFRGMARSLSQRLRRSNGHLALARAEERAEAAKDAAWAPVAAALEDIEARVHAADEAALAAGDAVPPAEADGLRDAFLAFYPLLNHAIGHASPLPDDARDELGLRAQKALLPYLLLTRNAERAYARPRGYAGDFMTVEMILQNVPRGTGRVGPALDRCWLESPFCAALRARRALLAEEIGRAVDSASGTARVAALGCGPAAELVDALGGRAGRAEATLVDFDPQALVFAADRAARAGLRDSVRVVEAGLAHLARGRLPVEPRPHDLVYSAALLDALDDAAAVRVLALMHALLRPGGRAVVAALRPAEPCRAFLDHVLEWRVEHRDRAALDRLFAASPFGRPADEVREGAGGLVLVAGCARA